MSKSRSLILVTVDCLRADHVGFLGYDRATTPFLDSLAAESLVFPSAIVTGFPTYYSFPSIFASRYPLALGRDVVGLAPGEHSLPSVLREVGYHTAAFNAGNPYISKHFGYDEGFDFTQDFLESTQAADVSAVVSHNGSIRRSINQLLERTSRSLGPAAAAIYTEFYFRYCQWLAGQKREVMDDLRQFPAADAVVDQVQTWVHVRRDGPFFLWIHLMDPHGPYYPTEKAWQELSDEEVSARRARYLNSFWNRSDLSPSRLRRYLDQVVVLYDAGIRWVDMQLTRLVDSLRQFGLWDDSVFVFSADHGEEFLDHGGRFHAPKKLTEELIRVPLLIRIPDIGPRELPKAPFSMLNLAPTLLDILDIEAPPEFQGRSYLPFLTDGSFSDEPVIVECVEGCTNPYFSEARLGPRLLAVRDERFKLVINFGNGLEQLFDLQSDPEENAPLPPDQKSEVWGRLLSCARVHLQNSIDRRDIRARLRTLLREKAAQWLNSKEAAVVSPVLPD